MVKKVQISKEKTQPFLRVLEPTDGRGKNNERDLV